MLVFAFVCGLAISATANAQSTCNPDCATGQLCVQGICMVPASPPPASQPPAAGTSPRPNGGADAQAPAAAYPPPPAGYGQPPAGYSAPPPGYGQPPAGYPPPPSAGYSQPPGAPPSNRGWAGAGYPPPPLYYPPPPANVHDGFYLRLHIGAGFTRVSGTDGLGNTLTISGSGPSIGIALGWTVAPNFVVFGNFLATLASEPRATENGVDLGTGSGDATVGGFGVGAAYYVQPVNLYLSATLAAMTFELTDSQDDTVFQSKTGVGFQALVGKEWWVSKEWGLGVAGEFVAATMKDKQDPDIKWNTVSFSVLFSATYN